MIRFVLLFEYVICYPFNTAPNGSDECSSLKPRACSLQAVKTADTALVKMLMGLGVRPAVRDSQGNTRELLRPERKASVPRRNDCK